MNLNNDTPISGLPEKLRDPIFDDLLITSQLISPDQYFTAKLTIATIYALFIANISIADVQQLQQTLDAMQQEINSKIDGSHTHVITEVTGLQNALDNKAAVNHSHTIGQIFGLQAELDKKSDKENLTLFISQVIGLQTALNQKANLSHTHDMSNITNLVQALAGKLNTSLKGVANGLAELDSNGRVPLSQSHLFIIERTNSTLFPIIGEGGKFYVDMQTGVSYRWNGTAYVPLSTGQDYLQLGETASTAYRGDQGKEAYDHSQSAHAPLDAQKNSDITKAEIEAKLTGEVSTHTHPNQGVNASDVLDIQLNGLDIANAEAGQINQTDTIRESFAKLQRQVNLLGAHEHNEIIDIGGENYYPYVVGDGILYNTEQTVTIQPGYYRLVAHSTPTMQNTDGADGLEVIVTRVLTGEIILRTNDVSTRKNWLSEIRKIPVGGFRNQPSTYQSIIDWVYSDMTDFKGEVTGWKISDDGLYYLFDTSNQITRPAKIINDWTPSGDFGVGFAVVSTIFHFTEPTDLLLTIPVMSYDPVYHDPTWGGTSDIGKGYVWFREVTPPSGG